MPNNHQNDHKQEQLDGVRVDYDDSTLTTNRGTRLSDTDNTLRAGARAHRGLRVIGVDLVPERLDRARRRGIEVLDVREGDLGDAIRDRTDGRGTDSVIDAVGMEAHGSPVPKIAQALTRLLPDILPLLTEDDPLGVETFATHRIPLAEAPQAYETFQKKQDGAVKYVMTP